MTKTKAGIPDDARGATQRPKRADAVRNIEAIVDAATRLLAA